MSDQIPEKPDIGHDEGKEVEDTDAELGDVESRVKAWKYRQISLWGGVKLPCYASPIVQMLLVATTCFLCPGMFNALTGLGGGGQVNADIANNANIALYAVTSVVSFFGGTICNVIGPRVALAFGGTGYAIYVSSFLVYNYTQNEPYVIFGGAFLGLCAGLLWTAQGTVLMSYPAESQKGKYISIFWVIFNMGAVIGSLVPLIQNTTSGGEASESAGDGTYIGFLVLTGLGVLLALSLCRPKEVIRNDGSKVVVPEHPSWRTEFIGLGKLLISDSYVIGLFPMFLASNWFYTYQFNDVNLAKFNIRTRALNNLAYWVAQIVGAMAFGFSLDLKRFQRRTRGFAAYTFLLLITIAIWAGGFVFQAGYTREGVEAGTVHKIDWTESAWGGPFVLYMCYGLFDAVWQTYVYWVLGALSNSASKLAFFAGFYKSIQSVGAVVMYKMDSVGVDYMAMVGSSFGLAAGSLLLVLPILWFKLKNQTEEE
ncbi:hypothetical protein Q7P37_003638 [Cladosporium fusiforme]